MPRSMLRLLGHITHRPSPPFAGHMNIMIIVVIVDIRTGRQSHTDIQIHRHTYTLSCLSPLWRPQRKGLSKHVKDTPLEDILNVGASDSRQRPQTRRHVPVGRPPLGAVRQCLDVTGTSNKRTSHNMLWNPKCISPPKQQETTRKQRRLDVPTPHPPRGP